MDLVGKIRHYYPNISVAVVDVLKKINLGDEILIKGKTTNFKQRVESMQIEHKQINTAEKGQSIGLKVSERVREGDDVFKL
ncbi:MAG: translation elongation factor-like protein [Candidatus Aenigmatarchaeota archaeon]